MNKLKILYLAMEASEQEWVDNPNDDDKEAACTKASIEYNDYGNLVYQARTEFETLAQSRSDVVDWCVCLENAGDATGWTTGDVEYWSIAYQEALNYISGMYN